MSVFLRLRAAIVLAVSGLVATTACDQLRFGTAGWPSIEDEAVPLANSATRSPLYPDHSSQTDERTEVVPAVISLWVDPAFPGALDLPSGITQLPDSQGADLVLAPGDEPMAAEWVFALVTPFASASDDVSSAEVVDHWRGNSAGPFSGLPLLLSDRTLAAFTHLWGEPDPGAIHVLSQGDQLEVAWARPLSWAIIPFEQIEPRWKVLEVDGQSPLHRDFDVSSYPLTVSFSLFGEPGAVNEILALNDTHEAAPLWPPSNFDANKITRVAMTGVTALVRATAWTMEQMGMAYPAADIGPWLREADFTHISNEVPFAKNCPFPDPAQYGVVFCSDSRYVQLLEDIGTDVVELTGDHFHDWGPEAMFYTLSMYRERGWLTYGGGATYEQGRQPVLVEHNGNRLAFIGCNGKGGSFARASATSPGSVACDFAWLQQTIGELSKQGVLVIATFQHEEHYSYRVPVQMADDFRRLADAGAVIVSGSQAHHPHGFEFRGASLIHFGLGNLFFDQFDVSPGTRQGFVDRHVFYDGRFISTELLTYVFVDYARARPMTVEERTALLRTVFAASGW